MANNIFKYDVIVIGSGAAGLGLALSLANHARVAIVTKGPLQAGASPHAQGGIAAVMSQKDSYDSHIEDTLKAGAGLCDRNAVEFVIKNAKSAIAWLVEQGVEFTKNPDNEFHLTREGGHSHRRIIHAADKTGAVVVHTLAEQVMRNPNIDYFTEHTAIDLIIENNQCMGVLVLKNENHTLQYFHAKVTVLATGGASSVYLHTSNLDNTFGDGIAMAWRAGCPVKNLEFNQFHPTCFYHCDSFLITEAMRGEGGILKLPNGQQFMTNHDPRAELASRDIVARAIDSELKSHQLDYVYLDISHQPAAMIKSYFPTIYQHCLKFDIDITKEPIPVVPAAHYTCGGVVTNLSGQTAIASLYAIGEVACTGLHGANRMASNSLLECLVFAKSAAQAIQLQLSQIKLSSTLTNINNNHYQNELDWPSLIDRIRKIMWDYVGIVRSNERLNTALAEIESIKQLASLPLDKHFPFTQRYIEFRNLLTVSELIVRAALERKESRGLHYNIDYPFNESH